jgi:sec-independent protein translocase protein TatB
VFDVGFSELILLFIIGLLVLGPEKLPQVANKLGSWVGQARRMTRMLKSQIEEELEFSKVRETVNQPLSSIMDKPAARPKPQPGDLNYDEGEDDESGFGETGHADAADTGADRPVPDPAAPPPDGGGSESAQPAAEAAEREPAEEQPGRPGADEPRDEKREDGEPGRKETTSS